MTSYLIPVLDNSNFATKVATITSRINNDPLFGPAILLSVTGLNGNTVVQILFQNVITPEKSSWTIISDMVNRIFNGALPDYSLFTNPRVVYSTNTTPIDDQNDYNDYFDPSSLWISGDNAYIRMTTKWLKLNMSNIAGNAIFSSSYRLSNGNPYVEFSTTTFTVLSYIPFSGIATPNNLSFTYSISGASGTGKFQIVNQSNSLIIASGTTSPASLNVISLFSTNTFSNIPTVSTILRMDFAVNSGTSNTTVRIYSVTLS